MEGGNEQKILFSAVQPSGAVTIGNYIGAIKNWVSLQDEYRCFYAVADLHAITVRQEPSALRRNTLEIFWRCLSPAASIPKNACSSCSRTCPPIANLPGCSTPSPIPANFRA